MECVVVKVNEYPRFSQLLFAWHEAEFGERLRDAPLPIGEDTLLWACRSGLQWTSFCMGTPFADDAVKLHSIVRRPDLRDTGSGIEELIEFAKNDLVENYEVAYIGARPRIAQHNAAFRDAFVRAGFREVGGRMEFRAQVADLPQEEAGSPFQWISGDQLGLERLAGIFAQASHGDPHGLREGDDPLEELTQSLEEPGLTSEIRDIHVGYIDGEPAAYIHVQVELESGWSRITYMGLLPGFRGKGLGSRLHRHGFSMMRDFGGAVYHGGTAADNLPMVRLFEKSGCQRFAHLVEWDWRRERLPDSEGPLSETSL